MENQVERYVELFKQFVMQNLQGDQQSQLRQYLFELIKEDAELRIDQSSIFNCSWRNDWIVNK